MNNAQKDAANRIIHEYLGRCVHSERMVLRCVKCGEFDPEIPAYCSNESPRRLLNEVEAKLVNDGYGGMYIEQLALITLPTFICYANAEQCAEAIVRTLGRWDELEK